MRAQNRTAVVSGAFSPAGLRALTVFEAWADHQRAFRGAPGMSVGIVHEGRLVWARGFGMGRAREKIPATPRTLYRVASITKVFTAIAAMQLRDEGKLTLDDPVERILPWFRIRRPERNPAPIRVRHLLTHTSGLPRESDFPYWTDHRFPSVEDIRRRLPEQESCFEPDTVFKYSNLAFALLGEIVEAASGEPYAARLRRRVLGPLGMTDSIHEPTRSQERKVATGYGRRMPDGTRGRHPLINSRAIGPAGGLASSVVDLARLAAFAMGGGRIGGRAVLREETMREMLRPQWVNPGWKDGYGLGFRIRRPGDRTLTGHQGGYAGYRTLVEMSLAEKVGVIVLTNSDDGDPAFFAERAFAWIAPALAETAAGGKGREGARLGGSPFGSAARGGLALPGRLKRFVGKYRRGWMDFEVLPLDGGLALLQMADPDPWPWLYRLEPDGRGSFRCLGGNGLGSLGETVRFEGGGTGRPRRIKIGANYAFPVRSWEDREEDTGNGPAGVFLPRRK